MRRRPGWAAAAALALPPLVMMLWLATPPPADLTDRAKLRTVTIEDRQ